MRIGTNTTAIVIGANLGFFMMWPVVAHVSGPDHGLPDMSAPISTRLTGHRTCFELTFAKPWKWYRMPERIELIDSVSRSWLPGTWRQVVARPDGVADHAWWSAAGVDSIFVVISEGAVGIAMRLSSTTDTLSGRAWTYTDSWDPWPEDVKVRAGPISCAEFRPAARRAPSGHS